MASRYLCPSCKTHAPTAAIDSRPTKDGEIRRRRECQTCGARFTTLEVLWVEPVYSIDPRVVAARGLEDLRAALASAESVGKALKQLARYE